MDQFILHRAESRGKADFGWLQSRHTFSFGQYYQEDRIHFGALRVLNDDIVAPGMGFTKHPHRDMEIISIPLEGALRHQDSMGNLAVIQQGEIQVMSAGTGITHSEMNHHQDQQVRFLQIWVIPKVHQVTPRYQQMVMDEQAMKNNFVSVISPVPSDTTLWIHQDAWFSMGVFDRGTQATYSIQGNHHGIYIFMIEGSAECEGHTLFKRDGFGIRPSKQVILSSLAEKTRILIMEVPFLE